MRDRVRVLRPRFSGFSFVFLRQVPCLLISQSSRSSSLFRVASQFLLSTIYGFVNSSALLVVFVRLQVSEVFIHIHLFPLRVLMSRMESGVGEDVEDEVLDIGLDIHVAAVRRAFLVGRLCADKSPNVFALMEVMTKAFRPKGKLSAREWGEGMIMFSFDRVDDRDLVLQNQPWHFDNHLFAITSMVGSEQPSPITVSSASFWVRAHDLPLVCRSDSVIRYVAAKVGVLEAFEKPSAEDLSEFVRGSRNCPSYDRDNEDEFVYGSSLKATPNRRIRKPKPDIVFCIPTNAPSSLNPHSETTIQPAQQPSLFDHPSSSLGPRRVQYTVPTDHIFDSLLTQLSFTCISHSLSFPTSLSSLVDDTGIPQSSIQSNISLSHLLSSSSADPVVAPVAPTIFDFLVSASSEPVGQPAGMAPVKKHLKRLARAKGSAGVQISEFTVGDKRELDVVDQDEESGRSKRGKVDGFVEVVSADFIPTVETAGPKFVFLCETKLFIHVLRRVASRLGFDFCVDVDCVMSGGGRSGGLVFLWNVDCQVMLKSYSFNHNDVEVGEVDIWRFTGIYGFPEDAQKWKTWRLLGRLALGCSIPWLCVGDYNEIMFDSEKSGGNLRNESRMQDFRHCVEECELMDLGFRGHTFTWSNKQSGPGNIQERLDRGLANMMRSTLFPHATVTHLPRIMSDHCPIFLNWSVKPGCMNHLPHTKLFRFEAHWL
ncbi:hypothetical protein ACS0TY_001218 [Phlomoides rotata]